MHAPCGWQRVSDVLRHCETTRSFYCCFRFLATRWPLPDGLNSPTSGGYTQDVH